MRTHIVVGESFRRHHQQRRFSAKGFASQRHARRGVILFVVLIVIAILSLAAYSYSQLMFSEYRGSHVNGRLIQARTFADSGVDAIRMFLVQEAATDAPEGTYDNPERFQGVLVRDSDLDNGRGRYAVVAPLIEEGQLGGVRFGLEDESTKLNLNTLIAADKIMEGAGQQLLMSLPGMTEDIADAILDWLDEDDEPRELGAEIDEYATLDPPYAPKNGPLQSVEELLLVRGVTPWLLFGADANRNGMIDQSELQSAADGGPVTEDGEPNRGWSAYLTLYSMERNLTPEGELKINLNENDLEKLHEQLSAVFPAEWVTFIIAYRQNGPYTGTNTATFLLGDAVSYGVVPSGELVLSVDAGNGVTAGQALYVTGVQAALEPAPKSGELDLKQPAKFPLKQVLDLVGQKVQVQFIGDQKKYVLDSPFVDAPLAYGAYLPLLMDYAAVNASPLIPGRININQASRTVLSGIPGITPEQVEEIIDRRTAETPELNTARRHETWILNEGIATLEEMKKLMPFMNAGGQVYRAQVVGYFDQGGPSCRVETVIDATQPKPRLLLWRELSHLGRGYPAETLGIEIRE
jgi:type II secretory pathway component PulK